MIFHLHGQGGGGGASLQRLRRILNPRFLDCPVKAPMSGTAADNHDWRRATRPLSVVALHASAHGARFHDANQRSDSVTPHVIRNREIAQLAICTLWMTT
jgi:hypothetical protein